ncbi:hypothetical protein LRP88_14109 [Fusarium phalaenopsidis]
MARPSRPRANSGAYREKFIAIGIDFGTTFSGVSWAFSEDPDNIHEISEWPTANHINQGEVQVPSLYDIDSEKWGYQVAPDMMPVKWFKLLLLNDSDLAKEDINLSKRLRQSRKELSEHPSKISAVNIVGRYLGKLWDHAQTILRTKLDIDGMSLRVAITVPAIWPHYAQKAMRKAADLAGITARRPMGAPTLELIHEPEAASLSIMLERSLLPEIKDVISYQVISSQPFRLKECVKGEGGLFGAVRIDEAFEIHLWGRDRLKLNSLSLSEYNTLVVEDWERGVKRTFTNQEQPIQFSLRLPLKAYKTRDRWRNKDHFSLNRSEVQGFFDKSLTGIRALVSEQLQQTLSEIQKEVLGTLPDVTARKSRYSYGICLSVAIDQLRDYDENLDIAARDPEGDLVAPRMVWYLRKGEEVSGKSPLTVPFWRYYKAPIPKKCICTIRYSPDDPPPKRPDPAVEELCTIECAFDTDFSKWEPVGDPDKGYRRRNSIQHEE